jgi:hypothetical protein
MELYISSESITDNGTVLQGDVEIFVSNYSCILCKGKVFPVLN